MPSTIPYDSERALELADALMGRIQAIGHDQSARLAEERGPFPNWPRSIYRDGRPLRNATVTTIAPTGTISMIAGCSSGIEPVFALAFEHRVKGPDGERVLPFVSHAFERLARARGFGSDALLAEVARRGSLAGGHRGAGGGAGGVQDRARDRCRWHVRHQAVFQRHADNGVSKTINLRAEATEDDVARAYLLAWELQCLGITVFRDGSKGEQVLHRGVGAAAPGDAGARAEGDGAVKPRPHSLTGQTYRMETPIGTAFITVNDAADGEPFEVFVQVGKAGSDTMAVAEALGRLVSLILRLPSPLSPRRRVEEMASQLAAHRGRSAHRLRTGQGALTARCAVPHAARASGAHRIGRRARPEEPGARDRRIGDLCRECGQATLVYEEGCRKCLSCEHDGAADIAGDPDDGIDQRGLAHAVAAEQRDRLAFGDAERKVGAARRLRRSRRSGARF